MAESKSKYAQTIASIRQRPAGQADSPISVSTEPVRGKGQPPGKRSNPEWKLYSHYLKKQTQRESYATKIMAVTFRTYCRNFWKNGLPGKRSSRYPHRYLFTYVDRRIDAYAKMHFSEIKTTRQSAPLRRQSPPRSAA
jgi:hypothetical protein